MRYGVSVIAVAIAASGPLFQQLLLSRAGPLSKFQIPPAILIKSWADAFLVRPENLPAPKSDPVAASRSLVIPYSGQVPRVMENFTVTQFVVGLENPRRLLVLPNNDVIVAEQRPGYLTLLRDQDGDGKVDYIETLRRRFQCPLWPRLPGRICAGCRSSGDLACAPCKRRSACGSPGPTQDHRRATGAAQARTSGVRSGTDHAKRSVRANCRPPEPSPGLRSKNRDHVCRSGVLRQHRRGAGG